MSRALGSNGWTLPTITVALVILLGGCTQADNAMNNYQRPDPWVIRTDFSNDQQWSAVRNLISAPQRELGTEFYAYVRFVSDEMYRDKEPFDIVRSLPDDYPHYFFFVVDRNCTENPEHPVLVVGFYPSDTESFGRRPRDAPRSDIATFRALPSQIQGIENNLSIANAGFEDFANLVDDDGVFRGFRD